MGETELSHDSFFNFSIGPFKVVRGRNLKIQPRTTVLANSETSPFGIANVWNDWLEFLTQIIKFAYMSLDLFNATSSRLSFW